MSRELLARAWQAGAGPGDSPLTIDLDSTICETYGLAKEGARHHGYTGAWGYHPLLAIAAGTGDVFDVPAARGPRQHRLRRRLVDLERDFEPVHRELDQVEEELRHLTVDWVRTRLGDARLDQMQ